MIRTRRRSGVTLTEVLVALFVMAIGMLALFTLFPLGAMKMAQALKDDRCAQTAAQADGFMRAYWRHVALPGNDAAMTSAFTNPQSYPNSITQPHNQVLYFTGSPVTYPVPMAGQPGYPVLVDPLGYFPRSLQTDQEKSWVGRASVPSGQYPRLIPRRNMMMRNPAFPSPDPLNPVIPFNQAMAFNTCTLLDDMTFQSNGSPSNTLGRQGRYNWAVMVQQPRSETSHLANMTILVFDGRPPLLPIPLDEVMIPNVSLVPGERSVIVNVPNRGADQSPLIRRGGWIMDGTIYVDPANPANNIRNANFYRIAGVTEGTPGPLTTPFQLDLETAIKGPVPNVSNQCQIYLFAGLAEVFERSLVQKDQVIEP